MLTNGSVTSSDTGYTISWNCYKSRCSNNVSDGTVITGSRWPFYVGPYSLVGAQANYLNNEDCTFVFQCAEGQYPFFSKILGESYNVNDQLQFINSSGAVEMALYSTTVKTTSTAFLSSTSTMSVRFFSDASYTKPGYKFNFQCIPARCSVTNSSNVIIQGAYSGTIKTDADGASSGYKYSRNEQCKWTVRCPNNMFVRITSISGSTNVKDTLSFYNASGYLLTSIKGATPSAHYWRFINDPGDLIITLVSTNATTGNGFTILYDCLKTQCSANGTKEL